MRTPRILLALGLMAAALFADGPDRATANKPKPAGRVFVLLESIRTTNDHARKRAMLAEIREIFRRHGHRVPADVRGKLFGMLTSVEPRWRPLIGDTIGELTGDRSTAQRLVDLLKTRPEHFLTRVAILRALGKLAVREVVPDLLGMLGPGGSEELKIVQTLGRIGGREMAWGLLDHLGRRDLQTRTCREIEIVLGDFRSARLHALIEQRLLDSRPAARVSYLRILSYSRDPKYAPAVRGLLDRELDGLVRRAAIRALGAFGDPESGRRLLSLVLTGSQLDQANASRALYLIRNAQTLDELARDFERLTPVAQVALMAAARRLGQPTERLRGLAQRLRAATPESQRRGMLPRRDPLRRYPAPEEPDRVPLDPELPGSCSRPQSRTLPGSLDEGRNRFFGPGGGFSRSGGPLAPVFAEFLTERDRWLSSKGGSQAPLGR